MSDMKLPLSRRHLDIAIERLASRFGEAQRIRRAVANTIVAQLMTDCVIKGGSSLKFRYGDIATRLQSMICPSRQRLPRRLIGQTI